MPKSWETNAVLVGILRAFSAKGVTAPPIELDQLGGPRGTPNAYQAPSVDELRSGLSWNPITWDAERNRIFQVNLPKYLGEEQVGEAELYALLTATYAACFPTGHQPMVVLAGYSQGAMLVHNVLNQLVSNGQTGPAAMIKGAVLIADPERMPLSDVANLGTAAANDEGLCPEAGTLLNVSCMQDEGPTTDVTNHFAPITVAVCDNGDIACDTSADIASNFTTDIQDVKYGFWVHTNCHSYCGDSVYDAGQWVGFHLLQDGLGTTPSPSLTPSSSPPTSTAPAGGGSWTASETPGGNFTCAIQTGGTLWCWGDNSQGELGTGETTAELLPTRVGTGTTWATVSAGDTWACAIRTDRTLWCWGDNNHGQLGTGDTTNRLSPTQVGTATTWAAVSAGAGNTCAIQTGGTLWCWGDNSQGELGTGDTTNQLTPTQVGPATNWATISAGAEDPCATRQDGTLWCWGLNSNGQLGTGDTVNRLTPTQVGTATNWATVSADDSTCAIRTDGTLWCWGAGSDGQLGTGDTSSQLTPVQVGTATTWAKVTAGQDFACATQKDGTLWCWGSNSDSQLGTGNQTSQLTPTRIGTASNGTASQPASTYRSAPRAPTRPCGAGATAATASSALATQTAN